MVLPEFKEDADWVVTFRPVRSGYPPICGMRRLLKAALRAYSFRVIDYFQPHQRPHGQNKEETFEAGSGI